MTIPGWRNQNTFVPTPYPPPHPLRHLPSVAGQDIEGIDRLIEYMQSLDELCNALSADPFPKLQLHAGEHKDIPRNEYSKRKDGELEHSGATDDVLVIRLDPDAVARVCFPDSTPNRAEILHKMGFFNCALPLQLADGRGPRAIDPRPLGSFLCQSGHWEENFPKVNFDAEHLVSELEKINRLVMMKIIGMIQLGQLDMDIVCPPDLTYRYLFDSLKRSLDKDALEPSLDIINTCPLADRDNIMTILELCQEANVSNLRRINPGPADQMAITNGLGRPQDIQVSVPDDVFDGLRALRQELAGIKSKAETDMATHEVQWQREHSPPA
jgi:hypothetical protein